MSALPGILAKLGLFLVTAVIGATVATVAVSALKDHSPVSTAGEAPEFMLAGAPDSPSGELPVAFDVSENPADASPVPTLAPADLALAADALIGAEPVVALNPTGFPRVPPVTQFDGGPFQNANCTLASGAMLARLGFGIVTTGSILRTLQDDQDGGTGLDDLGVALWRGYGISFRAGSIRTEQLKDLLAAGYGAVVQGDYSKVPPPLRLQASFTGTHAIYLDGYYPGDPSAGKPPAYYVIDPLGRPHAGYQGDWWPASIVDAFATSFGGGRVTAMWGFPPGGTPPDVVGADVLPIPSSGGTGPSPSLAPGETPAPSLAAPPEPGDEAPPTPVAPSGIDTAGTIGDLTVNPVFTICFISPPPAGCPDGVKGTFQVDLPVIQIKLGPTVHVVFVDSDRPNIAIVGFTVDPPAAGTVHFWQADGTPATIGTPSSMSSISLFGKTVLLARLDVLASTTYRFQAIAGSGLFAGQSPVGEFTTGGGVEQFDVSLSSTSNPVFKLGTGLSPYLHVASNSYAKPMVRLSDLSGSSCQGTAKYGGVDYCVDIGSVAVPTCTRAQVTYSLAGIDATGVLVRAYPAVEGVSPDGGPVFDGVLEASGSAPAGNVSLGCLTSGLSYYIVIDAVGDAAGVLASKTVAVP